MKSLKKYWGEAFKLNNRLSRKDFWVGTFINAAISLPTTFIFIILDMGYIGTEILVNAIIIVFCFLFPLLLLSAAIRRLVDVGRPIGIAFLLFVPIIGIVPLYFLLQEGKTKNTESEIDEEMGAILDQIEENSEKVKFVEKYLKAASLYQKLNCVEEEKNRWK